MRGPNDMNAKTNVNTNNDVGDDANVSTAVNADAPSNHGMSGRNMYRYSLLL